MIRRSIFSFLFLCGTAFAANVPNTVSGPGTTCTSAGLPTWNGTNGLSLNCGLIAGTTGNNVVVQTNGSGLISSSIVPTLNQNTTGSAGSLNPGNTINGVTFTGTTAITVPAAAGTLTGSSLASGVISSSLTSFGSSPSLSGTIGGTYTLGSGATWNGAVIGTTYGGLGANEGSATGVVSLSSGTTTVSNALPSATTATTQTTANNSTSIATTAYTDTEAGLVAATTISTTGGSTTLTASQYGTPTILVSGALTSAATLLMPNNGRWSVTNNTTGPWLLTIKTSSGTGITVPQGFQSNLIANGTNVVAGDNSPFAQSGFTNSGPQALDAFYGCLRYSTTGVCHIVSFADSIETCYQITPCTYGPYNGSNSPVLAFRNEFLKQYTQYGTGLRVPFRLMPTATVDGGEGGYTLTSGTVANAAAGTFGPGQTGYSLNGQALLTCTATCVLTINVGQGYRQLNIYCVQTATSTGWTVTVGGTSLGTACGSTSGTATGFIQSFNNTSLTTATASSWSISGTTLTVTTVASGTFAQGGVLSGTSVTGGTTILSQMTGTAGGAGTYQLSVSSTASSGTLTQTGGLVNSTFTLTSTGTSSYLGGYEAVTTTGTTGVEVDNFGEGAISSAFWTQNATALGWFNLIAAQSGHRIGMCIGEGGENDAQNPTIVTPAQVVTNWQTVATACQNAGGSFSFHIPTPYNSSTANQYAWIQQSLWQYGQKPTTGLPWDIILLSDAWASAGVSGTSYTGGNPNFITQDGATAIAQDVAMNLLQPADSQHPTDYGSCLIINYEFLHYSGGRQGFNCYWSPQKVNAANTVTLVGSYTNATTGFTTVADSTLHSMNWQISAAQILHLRCHLWTSVSSSAALSATIAGTGTPVSFTQNLQAFTGATAVADISTNTAAFSTAATLGTSSTATTVFTADYFATIQYTATTNSSSNIAFQMHASTGTLTVQPGSYCVLE